MKYAILINEGPEQFAIRNDAGKAPAYWGAYTAYGPFGDPKEQLAGFYLVDVPDLDAALEWASRCPGLEYGSTIEVRPEIGMP